MFSASNLCVIFIVVSLCYKPFFETLFKYLLSNYHVESICSLMICLSNTLFNYRISVRTCCYYYYYCYYCYVYSLFQALGSWGRAKKAGERGKTRGRLRRATTPSLALVSHSFFPLPAFFARPQLPRAWNRLLRLLLPPLLRTLLRCY